MPGSPEDWLTQAQSCITRANLGPRVDAIGRVESIGDGVAMVLQADVAGGRLAELLVTRELALFDSRVPVLASLLEVVVTDAVDGDLALVGVNSQVDVIPLAGWSGRVVNIRTLVSDLVLEPDGPGRLDRFVELVEPARFLEIVAVNVVLQLDFRAGLPGSVQLLGHVEDDPAISPLGDPVLECKFKMLVLLPRDNVAGTAARPLQGSVLDNPALGDGVLLVVAPVLRGLAVKQQFPATPFFCLGELVKRGIAANLSTGKK